MQDEAQYIHTELGANVKTFISLPNLFEGKNPDKPSFGTLYGQGRTDAIDLHGLLGYPVEPQFSQLPGGANFHVIHDTVEAAKAAGIPLAQIVPVYQAAGGGAWNKLVTLPTADQEWRILAGWWGEGVQHPVFDYAWSWARQQGDKALVDTPELQSVFKEFFEHNAAQASVTFTAVVTPSSVAAPVAAVTDTTSAALPAATAPSAATALPLPAGNGSVTAAAPAAPRDDQSSYSPDAVLTSAALGYAGPTAQTGQQAQDAVFADYEVCPPDNLAVDALARSLTIA